MALYGQDFLPQIDSIVDTQLSETDPGLMVGVVKDGNIICEKYRGLSNLQHKVKVNNRTRSNIASNAKQFTALMILDLSIKNKLNLEDDIRKYLPSLYPNIEEAIKIRHLLNHTSGIRDYCDLMTIQGNIWWKEVGLDNDDVMALIEKQEELGFVPGTEYVYSNSGYNVLARIIEVITDKSFNDYSKSFFEKLGMENTSFVKRYMGVIPNRANPYSDWGRGEWWQSPTVTKTNGEGFLFTTLMDQLIFEKAIHNASTSKDSLLLLSQEAIPLSEVKTYGFGLNLKNKLGRKAVHHVGATYGYQAQVTRFPNEKLSVIIISNNGNINIGSMSDKIATLFLPTINKNERYDSRFYDIRNGIKKEKVIDQYYYPNGETLVRIEQEGGKTYWREGNYYNLEMIDEGNNTFAFSYNPKLKIVFYKNEMIEYYSSGKTMIYTRSNDAQANSKDIQEFAGRYESDELETSFEIKVSRDNQVTALFSNRKKEQNVTIFNRNHLIIDNNILRIQRDEDGTITDIFLSRNRAKNNRFKKTEYY